MTEVKERAGAETPTVESETDTRRRFLKRFAKKGPVVIHPFLMAIFPIVFLYARNLQEAITPHDMVVPLEMSLGVVAVLMLLGWAIFRNLRAFGLVVTVVVLLFFSYGRVDEALDGTMFGRDAFLSSAFGILAVAAVALAFTFRRRLSGVTTALNLITAVLVVMNVIPIALYRTPKPPPEAGSVFRGEAEEALRAAKSRKGPRPDIYYIMPEDYGDERTLRDEYGIDTHDFIQYLRRMGFYVAGDSKANYQNTHQSLAASGNMQYLSTLLGKAAVKDAAVKETLHGFAAARFLQAMGYRYVHLGYWYTPTATDPTADVEVKSGTLSEFRSILYDTTILPTLSRELKVEPEGLDTRRAKYNQQVQEFEDLLRASKLHGPKFVFAHFGLPHAPFIFDRNGNFLSDEQDRSETYRQKFVDQVVFTTNKLKQVIGRLLDATGRKAVIILQTDEGLGTNRSKHHGFDLGSPEAVRAELLAKYRIFNAYFLPSISHTGLYPTMTPVNSFRLVFDDYFHAGFGLLPDEIYAIAPDLSRFVNITKIVQTK